MVMLHSLEEKTHLQVIQRMFDSITFSNLILFSSIKHFQKLEYFSPNNNYAHLYFVFSVTGNHNMVDFQVRDWWSENIQLQ